MATISSTFSANAFLRSSNTSLPSIVHRFVSGMNDGTDASKVRPSDWHAEHVIVGNLLISGVIGCAVYNSANKTLSTGGEGVFTFDSELFDTHGFHDNSTNAQRFTIPTGLDGKYLITIDLHASTDPGGGYVIARKNGSQVILMGSFYYNMSHAAGAAATIIDLVGTDYIEFKTLGNNAATITGTSTWAPQAAIMRLDSNASSALASGKTNVASQFSTTSSTPVLVTGQSIVLTTGARRCLVTFSGYGQAGQGSSGGFAQTSIWVDGAQVRSCAIKAGNQYFEASTAYVTDVLSAGSHTFEFRLNRIDTGTQTIDEGTFAVQELPNSAVAAGYSEGTSFPASPATNQKFYRTDRNLLYYFDGTRWLTVNELIMRMMITDALMPASTTPINISSAPTDLGDNGMYVTRLAAWTYVATTNNGSNYWTFQLKSRSVTLAVTNIGSSFNTSADTADQIPKHTLSGINTVISSDPSFVMVATKTSSPGSVYCDVAIYYRLIG